MQNIFVVLRFIDDTLRLKSRLIGEKHAVTKTSRSSRLFARKPN
jgi:hypothetical protein